MSNISKLDNNFKIETNIGKSDIVFYDVKKPPFTIHGVFFENIRFRRMPNAVAETVSNGVRDLNNNAAGGRIRFRTDSPYIAVKAKMLGILKDISHMPLSGNAGFDLYDGVSYVNSFIPPFGMTDGYESVVEVRDSGMREYTINMPLYSTVDELFIGLAESARVEPPTAYAIEKPIVYYGSSITQGGCASRPGNAYQSIISRRFNADFVNLGFSGNAKGELEMANYIKALEMSAFVYDYDHNAPSIEHLAKTHERMFKIIREANPELPILIMSRPKYTLDENEQLRLKVITETYNNAVKSGDKNVYMLNGKQLMSLAGNDGTVDNCHPNDFGFASIAAAVAEVFDRIFK